MSERSFRGSEDRLRDEVLELRQEVRLLRSKVERQEDEISTLVEAVERLSLRGEKDEEEKSEVSGYGASTDWDRVTSVRVSRSSSELGERGGASQASRGGSGISWEFRQQVARDVGRFLRRALTGDHRQNSGRDRLKLRSTCYLIVKDYEGRTYERPVRLETQFNKVVALCKRGDSWGDSIFVGLPSVEEARIAATEAGFAFAGPAQPSA